MSFLDYNPSAVGELGGFPVYKGRDGTIVRAPTHEAPTSDILAKGDYVYFADRGAGRVRLGRIHGIAELKNRRLFFMDGWPGLDWEVDDLRYVDCGVFSRLAR